MKNTIIKGALASIFITTTIGSAYAGGVLHRASSVAPKTLDPQKANTVFEGYITRELFEGLVTTDKMGKVIPALAHSWTVSPDGNTYTFKLRDAKWSDGKPITAHDVVFSYQRLFDPKTGAGYSVPMQIIAGSKEILAGEKKPEQLGAKAIDDKTVQLTLYVARGFFPDVLAGSAAYIVPKHAVEKHGEKWTHSQNIVVSSAFTLKERVAGTSIALVKNPSYWNAGKVSLDGVKYHIIDKKAKALTRYRAGDIHITDGIPAGQFKALQSEFGKQLLLNTTADLYFYLFNLNKIQDVRVRKALNLAVKRDLIAEKIVTGGEKAAYKIVAPVVSNYTHKAQFKFTSQSQSERTLEAKKLLKSAGYSKDNPLAVNVTYGTADEYSKVAVAMASMWKELGVKVKLEKIETNAFYDSLFKKKFEIAGVGFSARLYDAASMLTLVEPGSNMNFTSFEDSQTDALFKAAQQESNLEKWAELLGQAEQIALDNHVMIPIVHKTDTHLVSPKVQNYANTTAWNKRSAHLSLAK